MFGNTMAKNHQEDSLLANQIKADTHITGDISSEGDFRFDGSLKGTIHIKGKLVVGPTGNIDGEITCQNADISGTIKGNLTVHELLSLKSTSKLTGDIVANKLAIEPGANFSGSCSMGGVVKEIYNADRAESRKEEKAALK
jgi:cytoskeletal protein CcmA (bactofilin family)